MRRFTIRAMWFALFTTMLSSASHAGEPRAATGRGQVDSQPAVEQKSLEKALAEEEELYKERDQVAFKLRQIAIATNDDLLEQKALKLAEMAWQVRNLRREKLNSMPASEAPAAVESTRPAQPKPPVRAPNGRIIREDNQ